MNTGEEVTEPSDNTLDVPGGQREEELLAPGTPVGRYVVLSTLGVGGMGIVYAAFDPELDRKIALKVLRRSADTDEYQELLLREAKSMARVSHRNVAAIFDVGTVDGRVFLAMEYIDGLTLRDWSAVSRRSEPEVIVAMLAAGRGLAAAHRAGVVHRDFKPANVLIGSDGRVVVTDFGIAHAATEGRTGPRPTKIGTPAYMAPETLQGGAADARSDQFSFCITSFELLYGFHPFGGAGRDGIARAIIRGEPADRPRDSKVSMRVHGIVMRGLSANPHDRYASMEDLLDALNDDPSSRRRRWIGTAAVGMLAAMALVVFLTREGDACGGFQERVNAVWGEMARATSRAAFDATGVSYSAQAFELTDRMLRRYADEWVEMQTESCRATEETRAQTREVRILRAFCLEGRMKRLSAVAGLLENADADVVAKAAEAVSALPPIAGCADVDALNREVPPPDDPLVASAVEVIRGRLAEAQSTFDLGRVEQGIALARDAVAEAERIEDLAVQAEASRLHGRLLHLSGDSKAAEKALLGAVWSAVAADYDVLAFESWNELAAVYGAGQRDMQRSERAGRIAEAFWVRLDRDPFLGAELYASRGATALSDVRLDDARAALKKAVELLESSAYDDHPLEVSVLSNLAAVEGKAGRLSEAAELNARAGELAARLFGPLHPEPLKLQMTRGNMRYLSGDYEAALEIHTDLLRKYAQIYGEEHQDTARTVFNIAVENLALGNFEAARQMLERVIKIRAAILGPDHPTTLRGKQALVHTLGELGRYGEAVALANEVIAAQKAALGPEHYDIAYSLVTLAEVRSAEGNYREALRVGSLALEMIIRVLGTEHPFYGETLNTLGTISEKAGRRAEAFERFEASMAALADFEGDGSLLAAARFNWARLAFREPGLRERALAEVRAAESVYLEQQEAKADKLEEVRAWLREHAPRVSSARSPSAPVR